VKRVLGRLLQSASLPRKFTTLL